MDNVSNSVIYVGKEPNDPGESKVIGMQDENHAEYDGKVMALITDRPAGTVSGEARGLKIPERTTQT